MSKSTDMKLALLLLAGCVVWYLKAKADEEEAARVAAAYAQANPDTGHDMLPPAGVAD